MMTSSGSLNSSLSAFSLPPIAGFSLWLNPVSCGLGVTEAFTVCCVHAPFHPGEEQLQQSRFVSSFKQKDKERLSWAWCVCLPVITANVGYILVLVFSKLADLFIVILGIMSNK